MKAMLVLAMWWTTYQTYSSKIGTSLNYNNTESLTPTTSTESFATTFSASSEAVSSISQLSEATSTPGKKFSSRLQQNPSTSLDSHADAQPLNANRAPTPEPLSNVFITTLCFCASFAATRNPLRLSRRIAISIHSAFNSAL